jgi:hypothetical protein
LAITGIKQTFWPDAPDQWEFHPSVELRAETWRENSDIRDWKQPGASAAKSADAIAADNSWEPQEKDDVPDDSFHATEKNQPPGSGKPFGWPAVDQQRQ